MSTKERARLKRVTINASILFPNLFNIQHVHSNAATIHISDMFTVVIKFFLEEICVFVSRMSNVCNSFKKCEQYFRFEFLAFRQFFFNICVCLFHSFRSGKVLVLLKLAETFWEKQIQ